MLAWWSRGVSVGREARWDLSYVNDCGARGSVGPQLRQRCTSMWLSQGRAGDERLWMGWRVLKNEGLYVCLPAPRNSPTLTCNALTCSSRRQQEDCIYWHRRIAVSSSRQRTLKHTSTRHFIRACNSRLALFRQKVVECGAWTSRRT